MRYVLAVPALVLLAVMIVSGQEKPSPTAEATEAAASTTPDQVLEKWVAASGGKEALEKVNTQISKGTFDLPSMGATGTWERSAKAPNKQITIIDIPNFGVMKDAFDGTIAWEENPMAGLSEKSGEALGLARRDAELYRELNFKKLYPSVALKGKEKVGSRDAWVIEAKPPEGPAERYYFDAETGLLARHDAERPGPQGMAQMQMYFDEYREIDGVKFPFAIRQVGPGFELLLKTTEVKNNVPVEDSKFAKPAAK